MIMHTIRVVTVIAAPAGRCFDLARCVEAHVLSTAATGERVVAEGLQQVKAGMSVNPKGFQPESKGHDK